MYFYIRLKNQIIICIWGGGERQVIVFYLWLTPLDYSCSPAFPPSLLNHLLKVSWRSARLNMQTIEHFLVT